VETIGLDLIDIVGKKQGVVKHYDLLGQQRCQSRFRSNRTVGL
jgi:hypothetical protein